MKKLILTFGMAMALFVGNAQSQLGIVTVEKNDKQVPVDFWYVINSKDNKDQMFYYNETQLTKQYLKNMLADYGQSLENPFGKDEDGDNYWIITHPSRNIVYLYLSEEKGTGYAMIISITKD
jgi:hypothetical protein